MTQSRKSNSEPLTASGRWKRAHPERAKELNRKSNRRTGKRREQKIAWDDANGNGKRLR